jgi:F-type H+-transporting ATPase subunit delta
MAENSTIARPYAEALFAAAKASNEGLQETADHVRLLAELVELEDVRQAVSDPRLDSKQRGKLIRGLIDEKNLNEQLNNFIDLLLENDRLLLLPDISEQFAVLKDEAEGVAQAEIASAYALTEEQVSELVQLLEPKFNKKLKPHVTVDETLIGGVRVVVGDYVLDTSVQAQLNRMREALMA